MLRPFRFCSNCGAALTWDGASASQACNACGMIHYHNTVAAAGAIIIRDGKILLVQRSTEPFKGYWDFPGGFLDPGEHPRDTVVREVKEETGLTVQPMQMLGMYIDSYGEDGSYTLNIYYLTKAPEGDPKSASEVHRLGWFRLEDVPNMLAFRHGLAVLKDLSVALPNGEAGSGRDGDHGDG